MKYFYNLLAVLLGFALLSLLVIGVYIALRLVVQLFTDLEEHTASMIYAAVVAALFSAVLIVLIVQSGEKRKSLDRLREQKAQSYRCFLTAWSSTLSQAAHLGEQPPLHREDNLHVAEQQLLLWGSNHVIKHYVAYRQHETLNNLRDSAVVQFIDKVLQEIRKDLGQSNIGIQTGDLFNLFVSTARHDDNNINTAVQRSRMAHRLFNGVHYQGTESQ